MDSWTAKKGRKNRNSLRHVEDAPLVVYIISFSPGHQRVQNESQAMYKKTHKKGNMEPKKSPEIEKKNPIQFWISESKSVENIEAEKSLR